MTVTFMVLEGGFEEDEPEGDHGGLLLGFTAGLSVSPLLS